MAIVTLLTACQPPRRQRSPISGRTRATTSGNYSALNSSGSNGTQWNKTWGEITSNAGDQAFDSELYYFTQPSLQGLPSEDQLGFVSSRSGQTTGVRFYGNAVTTGAGGYTRSFDRNSMLIHIEVYDDRTGQQRSDGSARPPVVVEISPEVEGFVDAGGTITGAQASLFFQDQYGSVRMQGTINGQVYSGTIGYCNGSAQICSNPNNVRTLGNFAVNACTFFQCQ
jgi:hypothetical protein